MSHTHTRVSGEYSAGSSTITWPPTWSVTWGVIDSTLLQFWLSDVIGYSRGLTGGQVSNRNRNRKLQTSKAPLKSLAQGTSLFTSVARGWENALNQRGFPKNSPWEAQVRLPWQKVRGGRLGVKAGVHLGDEWAESDLGPALCSLLPTYGYAKQ